MSKKEAIRSLSLGCNQDSSWCAPPLIATELLELFSSVCSIVRITFKSQAGTSIEKNLKALVGRSDHDLASDAGLMLHFFLNPVLGLAVVDGGFSQAVLLWLLRT